MSDLIMPFRRLDRNTQFDTRGPHEKTTSTLSPDELSLVRAMFESVRFARLDRSYGHVIDDGVTVSLVIDTPSGRRRVVFHDDSLDATPPDALAEAINLMVSLRHSH